MSVFELNLFSGGVGGSLYVILILGLWDDMVYGSR